MNFFDLSVGYFNLTIVLFRLSISEQSVHPAWQNRDNVGYLEELRLLGCAGNKRRPHPAQVSCQDYLKIRCT